MQALTFKPTANHLLIDIAIERGCATDADAKRLGQTLLAWPCVEPKFPDTYEHAARLYRAARRQGLTIRSTVDCLMAALALDNELAILHHDRDFDALARICDLQCMRPTRSTS